MTNEKTTSVKKLKALLPQYLTMKGINIKKNFTCLNPNHNDKTPSMTYYSDNQTVYCHGCGVRFDIFDLYAVEYLQASINPVDNRVKYNFKAVYNQLVNYMCANVGKFEINPENELQSKIRDFNRKVIEIAQQNLDKTDYLKKRGISNDLAKKFNIGFVEKWVNPTISIRDNKELTPTPRLIIPTGDASYLARDTRPSSNIPANEKAYVKMKQGKVHIFNEQALYNNRKPIFITEGEFDALSVLEVTDKATAIALGSTANVNLFCKTLNKISQEYHKKKTDYEPIFLISTDNDQAGRIAAKELEMRLNRLDYDNYIVNIAENSKDANEELVKNREKFTSEVAARIKDPEDYLTGLICRIKEHKREPQYISTGFRNVDDLLDGGLYPQLYVIGANSSVGKTTLSMQIATYIAAHQGSVFYFSLETSKDELSMKNLSRLTYKLADEDSGNPQTARSIGNAEWLDDKLDRDLLMKAIKTYRKFYNAIRIIDGTLDRPTADDIYVKIKTFKRRHPNEKLVVIIDYLQILKPNNDNDTDKEQVTKSVATLKKITSEFDIPVIVISSFNRASYQLPVSMQSYKESGEIEYYADTLIGLQYQLMHMNKYNPKMMEKAMNENPRKIELVVLKNRNGKSNTCTVFDYYPQYNCFEVPNET